MCCAVLCCAVLCCAVLHLSPMNGRVQCRSLQPSNSRPLYRISWPCVEEIEGEKERGEEAKERKREERGKVNENKVEKERDKERDERGKGNEMVRDKKISGKGERLRSYRMEK